MKYLTVLAVAGLGWFIDPMVAFVVALSVLDANVELQTEVDAADPKPNTGWASTLKCWKRFPAPWYWKLILGPNKTMTGYHAWRIPTLILFFHLPYFFGMPWSISSEANLMFWFTLYGSVEDYLWFYFHPAYGPAGFIREGRAGRIWWMPVFWGPFPKDYYMALPALIVLKLLAVFTA